VEWSQWNADSGAVLLGFQASGFLQKQCDPLPASGLARHGKNADDVQWSRGRYLHIFALGDAQTTASGSDLDPYHYAQLDYHSETTTDHAQFRQYNSTQGRWMRPDPYYGSYDLSNPQSMNRHSYVLNNPLTFVDPNGLNECACNDDDDDYGDGDGDDDSGDDGSGLGGNTYAGNGGSTYNIPTFANCSASEGCVATTYVTTSDTTPGYCDVSDPICALEYQLTIQQSQASVGTPNKYNYQRPFSKPSNGGYPEPSTAHKDQCNQIKTDADLMTVAGFGYAFLNKPVGIVLGGVTAALKTFGALQGCNR
jgi:RHS repeat-associated protein